MIKNENILNLIYCESLHIDLYKSLAVSLSELNINFILISSRKTIMTLDTYVIILDKNNTIIVDDYRYINYLIDKVYSFDKKRSLYNLLTNIRFKNLIKSIQHRINYESQIINLIVIDSFAPISKLRLKRIIAELNIKKLTYIDHGAGKETYQDYSKKLQNVKTLSFIYDYKNNNENNFFIPYSFTFNSDVLHREKYLSSRSDSVHITFTIPGYVEEEKRRYKDMFQILSNLRIEFTLVLSGRVIDKDLIKYAKTLGINLKYYNRRLSDDEFRENLINSDFILHFPNVNHGYEIIKASGIPFDAAKYGVPLITDVTLNEYFHSILNIISYPGHNLINQLNNSNNLSDYYINLAMESLVKTENNTIKNYLKYYKMVYK